MTDERAHLLTKLDALSMADRTELAKRMGLSIHSITMTRHCLMKNRPMRTATIRRYVAAVESMERGQPIGDAAKARKLVDPSRVAVAMAMLDARMYSEARALLAEMVQ